MHTNPEDGQPALTQTILHAGLLGVMLAALAAPAAAQLSGSATVVSAYRYRGMALSEGRPAVQAGLNWDGDGGWYGGALAAQTRGDAGNALHLVAYGGRAWRLGSRGSGETGFSASRRTDLRGSGFGELYAGLAHQLGPGQLSARLYYAPDYFGLGTRTVYGEINGSWPLAARLQAFAHAGTLRRLAGSAYPRRADLRAGIAASIGPATLQLALERADRRAAYAGDDDRSRNAMIASASFHY